MTRKERILCFLNTAGPVLIVLMAFAGAMAILWMFSQDYVALRQAQAAEARSP